MFTTEDMFGETIVAGDWVIATRPAYVSSTYVLQLCKVNKVHAQSITLQPIEQDGSIKVDNRSNYNNDPNRLMEPFNIKLKPTYGKGDKIVKYRP